MTLSCIHTHWNTEKILDDIHIYGFSLIDNAYPETYFDNVREECLQHLAHFRSAAIQHGVIKSIRSDQILWIDDDFPLAQHHLQNLRQFSQNLNRAFYLGITEIEAHFACYNQGEFYAKHRDNPQQKNNRIISCVLYLNEHWQSEWGGELHLQDKQSNWHTISPQNNRLAIFQSNLLHEVYIAQQQRLSITAWLRSSDIHPF